METVRRLSCSAMVATSLILSLSLPAFASKAMRPADPGPTGEEQVVLSIGRSTEWRTPSGLPVTVSNGAAIRVRDLGRKIKVTATKLGSSTIRAGARSLAVNVVPERLFRLYEETGRMLKGRRGLKVMANANSVIVHGRLLRLEDWTALGQLVAGTPKSLVFSADVNPDLVIAAEKHFKQLLKEAQLPDLPLHFAPQARVSVPTEPKDLEARVSEVLGAYGFRTEASASALGLEPMVRVRIVVAEVRKSMLNRIGIRWPAAAKAQLLPSFEAVGTVPPHVLLEALESQGLTKILASPVLLCRSGKKAEFLAGGEFPIKIANLNSTDVIWKKYGILLKIQPLADLSGRMSIGIETEVSMIDPAKSVDGLPGLLTNRIESHFDLTGPRTIALSGLIKKEWGDVASGLPGLVNLPVLGPLFGSREYRDDRTELVVFVTPEMMDPTSKDAE